MASVAPESGELAPETKRPWKLCSETMQVKVIVVVMTVVMAAFEVGDRMLVVDFVASFFTVVSLDLFEQAGVGGAILGVLLAVSCVAAVVWGSRKIEAMEAYAVKFDDASWRKNLGDTVNIGPPSLKALTCGRRPMTSTSSWAPPPRFSQRSSPTCCSVSWRTARYERNLKSERVREKVKLEYNGDAAKIKDLCRGLVVAETLPALEASCAALRSSPTRRRRNPPGQEPATGSAGGRWAHRKSGYRDLNVNIRFQKHICEVQISHSELLKLKADQTPVYNLVRSLGLVIGRSPRRQPRRAADRQSAPGRRCTVLRMTSAARRVRGMELRGAGLWGGHGARRTGPGEDQADDSASPRLRGRHGAAVLILRVPTNPGSSCAIRLDVRALRSRRSDLVPPSHIRGGRNTVHGFCESRARHARCARLRGAIFLQLAICRAVPGGGGGRLAAPRTPKRRVPEASSNISVFVGCITDGRSSGSSTSRFSCKR